MHRSRLIIGLLVLLMALSGCSANRFLYNRADTFIRWAADDYVSLNGDQQALFDENIDGLMDWHRREELQRYRELIVASRTALDQGVTLSEAEHIAEEIDAAADRFQGQFIELLLKTAEGLTDAQVEEFLAALEVQQEEYAEERLTRDEEAYYEDSATTMIDLLVRLMGRLSKEQKAEIKNRSEKLMRIDGYWHRDRQLWGGKLGTILEVKGPGWQDDIRRLASTRSESRAPEYVSGLEHNGDIILALLVDMINSRSERQDRKLARFLQGLIDDIDALTIAVTAEQLVSQ